MFFQEATPDTSGYMIAGYAIAFLIMGLYVASIYLRSRNLHQDMTILEEMEEAAPPAPAIRASPPPKASIPSGNHRSARPLTKKARKK
jgi:hypothetical protein